MNPQILHRNLYRLFCKKQFESDKTSSAGKTVYQRICPEVNGEISFKLLHLNEDLPKIYEWVNQEYAYEYWQMNGRYSQLYAIYQCMEHNPYAQSFTGWLDDKLICQFDVYSLLADELSEHIISDETDCGFHLLMAPNENPISGLTSCIISAFLEYFFSFPEAKRMYAEPDINNSKSVRLLEVAGFERTIEIEMSYKKAIVYRLIREQFERRKKQN